MNMVPVCEFQVSNAGASDRIARSEIVDAARGLIAESGWHSAGSARVAVVARVSKALVHYHFSDKRALLVAVAESCGRRIAERTKLAASAPSRHANPIDDFSDWLDLEMESADLRIALQLAMAPDSEVHRAVVAARGAYRTAAANEVLRVFATLGLTPRVSESIVVGLVVTVSEGLAIGREGSRRMIEALWLGLLTLAD